MKHAYVWAGLMMIAVSGSAFAGQVNPSVKDTPTVMVGITLEFGEHINAADIGFTGKVISSNAENKFVVGAGLSYFPWTKDASGPLGIDVSAGYNFTDMTATGGFDVLRFKPQMSIGFAPTQSEGDVFN